MNCNMDLMRHAWLIALCFAIAGNAALAQTPEPVQPVEGQAGKDVVWIPSPRDMVEKMLEMARVTPQDYVIDLGSGDGRNVIAAARRGARALGVEYNPDLVAVSRRTAAAAGVAGKAAFVQGYVRGRHLAGDGPHPVPVARQPRQTFRKVPRPEARHPHRFEYV